MSAAPAPSVASPSAARAHDDHDFEHITYEELERFDSVSVELVPERKSLILKHCEYAVSSRHHGTTVMRRYSDFVELHDILLAKYAYLFQGLILKHCEYAVSSRRHGTTVMRRYSDFVELHDILLAKYPYRALCRLPPKRVVVGGGGAVFLERRRAALQRWLALTAAHPVLAHDADIRAFLCEPAPRLQRPHHDEFTLAASEITQEECVTEEMTSAFSSEQEQLRSIQLALARLAQLFTHAEERGAIERAEVRELGAALAALSAPTAAASAADNAPAWLRVRRALRQAATVAGRASDEEPPPPETEAERRLRLALDAAGAHRDLCARLTRGLHAERARAATKSTSLSQAGAASVLRARHRYALRCAAQEARAARAYALAALESLPELMQERALAHAGAAALWAELCKALQRDPAAGRIP